MHFSTFTLGDEAAQVIGIAGFLLYVFNYLSLTFQFVHSAQVRYFCLNALAAACVLVGLLDAFNLPAAMIQVFFLLISLGGIGYRLLPDLIVRQPGALPPVDPHSAGASPGIDFRDRGSA